MFSRSGDTVTGLACAAGQITKWSGAAFACGSDNDTDTGITSLNGLTAVTQTYATGNTGTDFNIVSSGSVHTFNIPDASVTARGLVTTGAQTLAGNKTLQDNLTVNGTTITFGDAATDISTFNSAVSLSAGSCASSSTNIFCNNGNSLGAAATIGTNDSFGLNFETNSSIAASLSSTGEFLIKDPSNSTISFQVQNSTALPTFSVDTTGNRIVVGSPIADATGISLVLDSSTLEPTGVNGAMYYNSTSNRFRCFEAGAWVNCIQGVKTLLIATKTTTQTLTATPTAMPYNSASINVGTAYNTATGVFTAPSTGIYEVTASAKFRFGTNGAAPNVACLQINAPGATKINESCNASENDVSVSGTDFKTAEPAAKVNLTSGQTITILVYAPSGTVPTLQTTVGTNQLSIVRLE